MPTSSRHPAMTAHAPVTMRPENRRLILDALEREEMLSRTRLAAITGLGAMTIQRAVRQLCLEGILTELRASDPHTGRQCGVLSPAPLVPILVIDLSVRSMTAYLLCSPLFLPEHCQMREIPIVTFERWEEFSTEDNLRLFLARIRQQLMAVAPEDSGGDSDSDKRVHSRASLTRRQRAMTFRMAVQEACTPRLHGLHPVLLLPPNAPTGTVYHVSSGSHSGAPGCVPYSNGDGKCYGTINSCPPPIPVRDTPEHLTQVVLEELEHPDHPLCGGLTVADTRAASLYALSHSTLSADRTSLLALLLGEHMDSFLMVRQHAGSDWFVPDCLHLDQGYRVAPLTGHDPTEETRPTTAGHELSALLASCMKTVRPQVLSLELTAMPRDDVKGPCLEGILPNSCRLFVNQTSQALPLCVRGAAMMARRRLWDVRAETP